MGIAERNRSGDGQRQMTAGNSSLLGEGGRVVAGAGWNWSKAAGFSRTAGIWQNLLFWERSNDAEAGIFSARPISDQGLGLNEPSLVKRGFPA
jgi:hypothetical protein